MEKKIRQDKKRYDDTKRCLVELKTIYMIIY